jgi:hypothetical protein
MMFFEEHEKQIYSVPFTLGKEKEPRQYDPLVIDSYLMIVSENKLNELIGDFNSVSSKTGDIGADTKNKNQILHAHARLELARIARKVFTIPEPPECLDAHALEVLFDFVEWMEKKGKRESL